jgi:hypothetical protein
MQVHRRLTGVPHTSPPRAVMPSRLEVDPDGHDRPSSRALGRVLRFELRALALAALGWVLVLGTSPWTVPGVDAAEPKVVIVVGPTGPVTDAYRADADRAAAVARTFTGQVATVYSPDATWTAVRDALQGASIVIYLGHGNGWPSPYSTAPRPQTQNGLGLNPVAGVDDVAHQYFGEAYLAKDVHLAPHAVVLLHHLCYASGHPEPGMPEGTFDVIRQRVEGYASGWIAAGADAVIADSSTVGPATYVERILSGAGTIESIWRTVPSFHDHVVGAADQRDPGFSILLDPTRPDRDYYRSIVGRLRLSARDVAAGARAARGSGDAPAEAVPTTQGPVEDPVVVGTPSLDGRPVAGSMAAVTVAFASGSAHPDGLRLGLRWDPLRIDDPAANLEDPLGPGAGPRSSQGPAAPTGSPSPDPTVEAASPTAQATPPTAGGESSAAATASPSAPTASDAAPPATTSTAGATDGAGPDSIEGVAPALDAPGPVPLVQPEERGALVVVAETSQTASSLVAAARIPDEPGLYRLSVTVHSADGIALEDVRQTGSEGLLVRVTASASMTIAAPPRLDLDAGRTTDVGITVTNTGADAWAALGSSVDATGDRRLDDPVEAVLLGHWVALDGAPEAAALAAGEATVRLPGPADAGADMAVTLPLTAPTDPGRYLLVLDVVTPDHGSLVATGSAPVEVRVAVRSRPPTNPEHTR